MKILYIDTRAPGHNSELHIDFIKFMHQKKFCKILPYGSGIRQVFPNAINIDKNNVLRQLEGILLKHKPDAILTYNRNGSAYDDCLDNIGLYRWVEEALAKISIPKFHVTTDYCRTGYKKEQAGWFEDLGYTAAIFRHRESLKHPCKVDSYWLPFSVDANLYAKANNTAYFRRKKAVSFIGTAFQDRELYKNRIAAINALQERDFLSTSKLVSSTGYGQMLGAKGYREFLTKHMFGLTCGGSCNYMTAKYFQIPAAGALLVCSNTNGLDLFPEDTYIKYSINNIDRLCADVEYFIKNRKEARGRALLLSNYVLKNHNHKIRTKELLAFMKKYI